jgi:hypothetical protein
MITALVSTALRALSAQNQKLKVKAVGRNVLRAEIEGWSVLKGANGAVLTS